MTPEELISAAESGLADAERNLASCVDSLRVHRERGGGVPNSEVLAVAHAQATIAQAYAALAMAKTARAMLTGSVPPAAEQESADPFKPEDGQA
jgi:hypothetical protein